MDLEVAIIDYGISNMFSVSSACDHLGLNAKITRDRDEILQASSVILPGVGTFSAAMENLEKLKLIPVIKEFIASGKPFLGICLGMQLLMTKSEEFGEHKGLDIIPGEVKKFPAVDPSGRNVKVPHVGWNKIKILQNHSGISNMHLFKGLADGEFMYFVHSFYVVPDDKGIVAVSTNYAGIDFPSCLISKNIFTCQFHPEKSGNEGLKILKNFSGTVRDGAVFA